jgi:hypothetical protein
MSAILNSVDNDTYTFHTTETPLVQPDQPYPNHILGMDDTPIPIGMNEYDLNAYLAEQQRRRLAGRDNFAWAAGRYIPDADGDGVGDQQHIEDEAPQGELDHTSLTSSPTCISCILMRASSSTVQVAY